MKEKIAIIYLCRYGDIVNALPCAYELFKQGHEVDFHVHPQFASILESCTYVKPMLWHGLHRDADGCRMWCEKHGGYNRILDLQVNGNNNPPPFTTENFITQAWARAGMLDRFHDLPLVFDKRNADDDARAVKLIPEEDGRPLLVYSLNSNSSPMRSAMATEFEQWLIGQFGASHRLMNIGLLSLAKPQNLLAILEKAVRLITIDTLPLHLAYATQTPTIALQPGGETYKENSAWYRSEPRFHWIEKMTYSEAMTPEGHSRIINAVNDDNRVMGLLCRKLSEIRKDRIVHVVDWDLPTPNDDRRRRMLAAYKSWEACRNSDRHYTLVMLETDKAKRTSRNTISDTRSLPYIRDIIEAGCAQAGDNDIILLTNADICMVPEAVSIIRGKMLERECCFSRRVDVNSSEFRKTQRDIANMKRHVGADLFAFRKSWWVKRGDEFPDLLMACEGWDFVLRHMMLADRSDAEMIPAVIYHENHRSFWSGSDVMKKNIGQLHNRRLCGEWAMQFGCEDAVQENSPDGLFKPDERFRKTFPKVVETKPTELEPSEPTPVEATREEGVPVDEIVEAVAAELQRGTVDIFDE
jgi:hypothetical protein